MGKVVFLLLLSACATARPTKPATVQVVGQLEPPRFIQQLFGVAPTHEKPMAQRCATPQCEPARDLTDIDADAATELEEWIESWQEGGAKTLVLRVNSPGGQINPGFDMIRAIEHSKVLVRCEVDGYAASMAFGILQSCHERVATGRSLLMAHMPAVSGATQGKEQDFKDVVERLRVMGEALAHQYCRRVAQPYETCRAHFQGREWWMTPAEAQAAGVLDRVTK